MKKKKVRDRERRLILVVAATRVNGRNPKKEEENINYCIKARH